MGSGNMFLFAGCKRALSTGPTYMTGVPQSRQTRVQHHILLIYKCVNVIVRCL